MIPRLPFKPVTPISVFVTDGIDESGAQNQIEIFNGKCLFDEKAVTRRGNDGIEVELAGTAIIDGDISPGAEKISGKAAIDGGTAYRIHSVRRIRDFRGNVHHTELELI